jgi:ketosteroid isomerase-like protein
MDLLEAHSRTLDAFNRGDRDAWLEHLDPDFENVPPREWPETATVRGPQAVWDLLAEANTMWDQPIYEAAERTLVGDRIVARITATVRGQASGATVAWEWWHVASFRDGKAVRLEWFAERDEAFAAAGR